MAYQVIIKKEDTSHKVINTNNNNFMVKSINKQGPPGLSAYQIALNNGFVGTHQEWLESLHGLSAYQIALNEGFVGTRQEWLDSLKTILNVQPEDQDKILTNDGQKETWVTMEDKLNSEEITWDLGEFSN